MPKLNSLRREHGEVRISCEPDDDLVVSYRKSFITESLAARVERIDGMPTSEKVRTISEMLRQAVISWNLTDDDGLVIPLTAEALADTDTSVLLLVWNAIHEDMQPDPQSGSSSSNGSSAMASSEPRPTTTRSS